MSCKNKNLFKVASILLIGAFSFGLSVSCVNAHGKETIKVSAEESDGKWTLSDGSLSFQYTEWQTNGYVTETNQIMVYGHGDGTFDISYELLGSPPGATSAGTEYIADKTIQLTGGYWTPSETGGYGTVSGYPVDVNGLDSGTMITLNITVQYSGDMNEQNSGTGTTESNGWHYADEQLWYYSSGYGTGTSFYYNQPGEYAVSPNQANFINVDDSLEAYIYFDFLDPQGTLMSGDIEPLKLVSAVFSLNDDSTYTVSGNLELFDLQPFTFNNVSTISGDIDEPTTVECSYTITYYPNGADGEPANDSTEPVLEGEVSEYMLLHNMFERPNYIFLGWSTDSSSQTPSYEEGEKVYLRSDTSYYAIWQYQEPEYYTRDICFDPNNGEEFINRVAEGETLPLSYEISDDITPTYEGHTFNGWYYDGYLYQPGEVIRNINENITLVAQWEEVAQEIRYTIRYFPNGDDVGSFEDYTSYVSGDSLQVSYQFAEMPKEYEKEGYRFAGWSTNPYETIEAEYLLNETYLINRDFEVYPVWIDESSGLDDYEYEIIFDANNGTSETRINPFTLSEASTTYDLPSIEQIGFTREGYSFVGWSYYSDGEVLKEAPVIESGTTTTFYAIWELVGPSYQYTVTFDGNGATSGSTDPVILSGDDYSQTIIFPVCGYEREGYIFKGWGFNSEAVIIFQPGEERTDITSDTTFYAIWTQVFTISFDANGGDGIMENITIPEGNATMPECAFTREGYSFAGWAVGSPAGDVYPAGASVYVSANYVLFATWESISPQETEYTVRFNGNGATGGSMDDDSFTSSQEYSYPYILPECGFSRDGYVFAGWGTTETAVIKRQPGATIDIQPGETIFYAIWTQVFTISFDANGGTGYMEPISVNSGTTSTVPGCEFVRDGYSFAGWAVNSPDSETIVQPEESVSVNQDYVLFALWELVGPRYQYTVTFDGNGATSGSTDSVILSGDDYSQTIIFPECGYEREGYIFKGWGFNSEAIMTYKPGEQRTDITSDTTFYAIWTQVFTISFDANGGEGTMENITIPEGKATMPECGFTREGYSFAGWAVGSPTGDVYQTGASVYVSNDYTLYATWNVETPEPEPVYNQYWSYVDQELRWVDEAHPTYLTRVDKVIYSERSLTASVLISILNEKEAVVDTKYISLSNASYELISDGYGSVTGYFNLLIEDDKVIVLNNVVIAVEKIPETPEEKAADVSEEQIAQINSLLPETQDSRVEEVISDLNQGTAYQIVEVATDAKSFIDELRKEGGEGYTEAEYQRDLQTVQSATEAAVVVGAAAKDTNIATQVQEMTKSVPEDTGVNLNSVLKDFYEQQMQYLLGEAVAKKDGEQPTRRITRAEGPKVNKVDVTDFLNQEFDQMLDFVDRSVDDIEDTLLQVRKCSHESVKLAVNQSITTITSKSFRDFDKDKADREFVETLEPVMMATMQSQVLAVLEEEYNNSDHRNKDKDQVILDEIEAVKDIEMFRIMVMEVLRQKYESLDGSKSYEDDLEKFSEEIYWPCFEAWALDKDSPVGFTFEELTKATIESSSKRANSYVIATSADKPEIVFISVFAGVTAVAIAAAIAVPTVLKKKRRGLAE